MKWTIRLKSDGRQGLILTFVLLAADRHLHHGKKQDRILTPSIINLSFDPQGLQPI
jgi:hypothetical protein